MMLLVKHFLVLSMSDIRNTTNGLQEIVNNSLNKLENMTDLVGIKRILIGWNLCIKNLVKSLMKALDSRFCVYLNLHVYIS